MTKLKTLKAMGIEVWRRRDRGAASLDSASESLLSAAVEKRASVKDQNVSVSDDLSAIPRFRIAILHYVSIGICLSLEQGEDLPRRFCDDIARFMGADLQLMKLKIIEWPMLDTSGIDQSVDAARQVVRQRFATLPEKVLVIGAEIAEYFEPLHEVSHEIPALVDQKNIMLLPSLRDLLAVASKKRILLSLLDNWH